MVARIITGSSIHGLVRYNENKVVNGDASVIFAQGMLSESPTASQVIDRFRKRMEKNVRTKTNVVHISLNFSAKDRIDEELLQKVTLEYMERIGFGSQPFIVYRHFDTAHPHVHIITSNIDQEGKRIETHNIGKTLSENARVEIEKKYNLVRAEGKRDIGLPFLPVDRAVTAGTEKKTTITNIITEVMRTYRYSSHGEFKAALAQYGIGFRIIEKQQGRGMLYFIQDDKGMPLGVPIRASSIFSKPTYTNLEKRFERNGKAKQAVKLQLKNKINRLLQEAALEKSGIKGFKEKLSKNAVYLHLATASDGRAFGAIYVDHLSRSVFKGSELSKILSAGSLTKVLEPDLVRKQVSSQTDPGKEIPRSNSFDGQSGPGKIEIAVEELAWVLGPDNRGAYVEDPHNQDSKRKRKKRKKESK